MRGGVGVEMRRQQRIYGRELRRGKPIVHNQISPDRLWMLAKME